VSAVANPWFLSGPRASDGPRSAPALICLPHLGGNAAAYGWYAAKLAPDVRVLAVQLPGHGTRASERPLTSIGDIADALSTGLRDELRAPYVLYGHSFGALVAFEVARLAASGLGQPPDHLVVGACRAPDAPLDRPFLHAAPDADVLDYLRSMDGTPAELVDDAAVRASMLRAVRADLEAWETYRFVPGAAALAVPVTAIAGTADPSVEAAEVRAWRGHTTGPFRFVTVEGGHFFVRDARHELLAVLRDIALATRGVPA
jgi:medium-chain acyl-[acyl-carrier-protein] hydrolase